MSCRTLLTLLSLPARAVVDSANATFSLSSRRYATNAGVGLVEFLDLDPDSRNGGRAWDAAELRNKSFEDLQKLWILCVKEQNMLLSEKFRRKTKNEEVPRWDRMRSVRQTMARIKHVLTERAKAEPDARLQKLYMGRINAK